MIVLSDGHSCSKPSGSPDPVPRCARSYFYVSPGNYLRRVTVGIPNTLSKSSFETLIKANISAPSGYFLLILDLLSPSTVPMESGSWQRWYQSRTACRFSKPNWSMLVPGLSSVSTTFSMLSVEPEPWYDVVEWLCNPLQMSQNPFSAFTTVMFSDFY